MPFAIIYLDSKHHIMEKLVEVSVSLTLRLGLWRAGSLWRRTADATVHRNRQRRAACTPCSVLVYHGV